jgi:hypothetical protein
VGSALAFLLSLAIVFPHAKRTYPWFCELVVGYRKRSDNRKWRGTRTSFFQKQMRLLQIR